MNKQSATELELRALMIAGLSGDSNAHRAFLSTLSGYLRAYYRSKLVRAGRGPEDSEDLVQETLIAVHSRRHTYAIARYKLIDHLRQTRSRAKDLPIEEAAALLAADDQTPAPRMLPRRHRKRTARSRRVEAVDVATGKTLWKHEQRSVWYGSLLATGSGLVFGGDVDRWFNAFDATTGDILWRTRLAASAQGYPVTYEVEGRQYLAVPAGAGLGIPDLTPEIRIPTFGSVLYVFALSVD
jgi:hypothetical protein